jgi:hypothetical protein
MLDCLEDGPGPAWPISAARRSSARLAARAKTSSLVSCACALSPARAGAADDMPALLGDEAGTDDVCLERGDPACMDEIPVEDTEPVIPLLIAGIAREEGGPAAVPALSAPAATVADEGS